MLGKRASKRYFASFDGLRTLAVLAVIAYHMHLTWLPGGLVGVTLFFVLSGYLITSLLFEELSQHDTIRLKRFWIRRIKRLFPAIVLVLCTTSIACALFNQDALLKLKQDFLGALLWFANWHYIVQDLSYFEAVGSPSPVQHFWSLSIEEQFYLVWPLLLLGAHKLKLKRKDISRGILVLAFISLLAMMLLFDPALDPSRVYYGTDTRAFSLLVGASLAGLYPAFEAKWKPLVELMKRHSKRAELAGWASCVAIVLYMVFIPGTSEINYRGGLFVVSLLCAILIWALTNPNLIISRIFAAKPLVWMGQRSYGMYLWHFPILILCTPPALAHNTPWWLLAGELALIVGVSALSYRFVENPIRKGSIQGFFAFVKAFRTQGLKRSVQEYKGPARVLAGAGVLSIACAISLLVVAPLHTNELAEQLKIQEQQAEEAAQKLKEQELERERRNLIAQSYDPVLIGDSVALACIDNFNQAFPAGYINARISRQLGAGLDIFHELLEQKKAGKTLVLALGTNGDIEGIEEKLNQIPEDIEIYLVNLHSPDAWAPEINRTYAELAEKYARVHVIDWNAVSADHSDWFWQDATHLRPEGAAAYIKLIKDVIGNRPDIKEAEEVHAQIKAEEAARMQAEAEEQARSQAQDKADNENQH